MSKIGTIVSRARALKSFVTLVRDPSRLDQVFEVAEHGIEPRFLEDLVAHFSRDPRGRRALQDRRRVHLDVARLERAPAGSLGRAYLEHMRKNGLDPSAIPTLPATDATSYVQAHLYETHDIWHTVTGFGADPVGEIGLQAFYLAQFPARLASFLLAAGFLHVGLFHIEWKDALASEVVRGWEIGQRARPFFGVVWDELWDRPLEDVRRDLGVVVAERTAPVEETTRAA